MDVDGNGRRGWTPLPSDSFREKEDLPAPLTLGGAGQPATAHGMEHRTGAGGEMMDIAITQEGPRQDLLAEGVGTVTTAPVATQEEGGQCTSRTELEDRSPFVAAAKGSKEIQSEYIGGE